MKNNINDVLIIGAGPAGITAALYLKRAGIEVSIMEKESPGGTLNKIHKIENYPGYVDLDGPTLAFRMFKQIEELEVPIIMEEAINIKKENGYYKVVTNKNEYLYKYIILATGKTPRKLDVKDANKYENKGISYCVTCDGALYKNKPILIVGGGNSAISAALYMTDIASKIYIVNRSDKLRSTEIEKEIILKNKNIEVLYNSKIKNILGDKKVEGVLLNNGTTLDVNAIFVCIGQVVNNSYYQNLNLKSDDTGIIVDKNMQASENNVYACGDQISKKLYQVVTATSEGAIAANSIIGSIKKNN